MRKKQRQFEKFSNLTKIGVGDIGLLQQTVGFSSIKGRPFAQFAIAIWYHQSYTHHYINDFSWCPL